MNNTRAFGGYRFWGLRLLVLSALGMLGLLGLAASGVTAQTAGQSDLETAVVEEVLGQKTARSAAESFGFSSAERREKTQTNVQRTSEDGNWAFGTAIVEAPKKEGAYPQGWLFVAEKTSGAWRVGLQGSDAFSDLTQDAPAQVMEESEKELLTGSAAESRGFQATSTRLRLPWKRGLAWKMSGGPHGWATGYDRPYSALDLNGRGGKVRSAGAGRVYKMCGSADGWLRVYHYNGYSTDYYHLRHNIKPRDGRRIKAGTYLGLTGQTTCGGGAAYGNHVHFALLRGSRHVALDNKTLSGWTFQQGKAYYGHAKRNTIRRYAGDLLRH